MRPNNKRAQEEKAAEEARRMSGDGQFNEQKETPRIVWFKPSDKRVPLIAIPIEQVPENFVTDSEEYQQRLFVVSLRMPDFNSDEQTRYKYFFFRIRGPSSDGQSHLCILSVYSNDKLVL